MLLNVLETWLELGPSLDQATNMAWCLYFFSMFVGGYVLRRKRCGFNPYAGPNICTNCKYFFRFWVGTIITSFIITTKPLTFTKCIMYLHNIHPKKHTILLVKNKLTCLSTSYPYPIVPETNAKCEAETKWWLW